MDLPEKVKAIMADTLSLPPEEVTDDSLFIGELDFLDAIAVVMEIEEEFDIQISNEQMDELKTVRDLINWVNEMVK